MSVPREEIHKIITPLRLIFWGGIVCVFDFTINGFDLLPDLVGLILIAMGVFQIAQVRVHDRYSKVMFVAQVVSVLACFKYLHDFLDYKAPAFMSLLLTLFGLAVLVAIVLFCVAMRWLSTEAELENSERSWRMTMILFVVIYLLPMGFFYCAAAVAVVTGETFDIQLGGAAIPILLLFFVPLIHLFVSTSRMKREASGSGGADRSRGGTYRTVSTPRMACQWPGKVQI